MKKISLIAVGGLMMLYFVFPLDLSSQGLPPQRDPRYGVDSISRMRCAGNLSTLSEFMKIDLIEYATDAWKYVYHNCPQASKNIYIHGVRIIKHKIDNAESPEIADNYVDSLMALYDKRILYFKEEGLVLGRKGIDLLRYRRESLEEAYGYLRKSSELLGHNAEDAVLVTLMQVSAVLFKTGGLDAQAVINDYLSISEILEIKKKHPGNAVRAEQLSSNVESLFAESGAADCDAIVEIFAPRFEANKQDVEFLKRLSGLLSDAKCEEKALFESSSEQLHLLEPSAESAYFLFRLLLRKEEYERASEYLLNAIELQTNKEEKAKYYYQLAALHLSRFQRFQAARTYALEAAKLNPGWGDPYILIGNAYVASMNSCGSDNFERNAIYWVAVDKYNRAKSVDSSVTEEANRLINQYSVHFPKKEDAFFYGYTEGNVYTVGCWINESTTVRF